MIDYKFKDLVRILTKIGTNNCLWMPYKCTKFQLDRSKHLPILWFVRKDEEGEEKTKKERKKNWNFGLLYLWRDLLQSWNVAYPYRQAPPQQI